MNYLGWVSWGMYGGSDAAARANLFASWGLMDSLTAASTPTVLWVSILCGAFGSILGG